MKKFFTKMNISLLAFSAFAIRLIVLGSNISDAIALLVFAGLFAYDKWLHFKDFKPLDEIFIEKTRQDYEDAKREIDNVKSAVSAIKIGAATWGINGRKQQSGP